MAKHAGRNALGIAACMAASVLSDVSSSAQDGPRWYKGNTHAHTELCGHADSSPEAVARWYLDHGYHFLVLSEHNIFIDPATVPLPEGRREDFILIPGQEITGQRVIHTTAFNTTGLVPWEFVHEHKHAIIQNHVDGARAAGGELILNHPNFHYAVSAEDVLPVEGLHLFELYNGHPAVNNEGNEDHPSTEELWDVLLTAGMPLYAVSSDDAHHFKKWGPRESNPGRGWVMVLADGLTPDAIVEAMLRGNFYATSGVVLSSVGVSSDSGDRRDRFLAVVVDPEATMRELESPLLIGRREAESEPGFLFEFVGPGGRIVHAERRVADDELGHAVTCRVPDDASYLRCRVSYARPTEEGGFERFFAWTQPVFTDGRAR